MVHPPCDPPKLTVYTQVTQDEIGKIISKSPTKSCLLDPLPTFLIKECIDIFLPSITKLRGTGSRWVRKGCSHSTYKEGLASC